MWRHRIIILFLCLSTGHRIATSECVKRNEFYILLVCSDATRLPKTLFRFGAQRIMLCVKQRLHKIKSY